MSSSGRRRYHSASSIGPSRSARNSSETAERSSVAVSSSSLRPAIGRNVRSSPSDFATYNRMAAVMICATASSDTRRASPRSIRSRAAASSFGAASSIQAYSSLRRGSSGSDIHPSVADDDPRLAQLQGRMTRVLPGFDIVFIAVPRTDDMRVLGMVLQRSHCAVALHRLDDTLHDPALTHRTAAMSTFIVPGVELAIDQENSDLGLAAFEQQAAGLLEVVEAAGAILGHESSRMEVNCRRRKAPDQTAARSCRRTSSIASA